MILDNFIADFQTVFPIDRLNRDELLKTHTTWRVGGKADLFFEAKTVDELVLLMPIVHKNRFPFFILGGGSNILISDKGIRGLVVKNSCNTFEILDGFNEEWEDHSTGEAKHTSVHYNFYDDDKNPSHGAEPVFVRVDSGYSMTHFIRDSQKSGLTGLEWFSRIPGTMGGWIYNNVHGHTLFIGDFVHCVRSVDRSGNIVVRKWHELEFDYDYSTFHKNDEVILDVTLRLFKGNVDLAQEVVREVIIKKNLRQAANSAGSVFHNISAEDQIRNGFESNSVGYIVDKVLGWNGTHRVGGAWISEKNGNFIETDGSATAQDVISVIDAIKKECNARFGIKLKEEIFRVGEF
jgi:UDP-N-acetylmuramate dehydrogenase